MKRPVRFPEDHFIPELRGERRPTWPQAQKVLLARVHYLRACIEKRWLNNQPTIRETKELAAIAFLIEAYEHVPDEAAALTDSVQPTGSPPTDDLTGADLDKLLSGSG